jgi:methylated-DNA-[protein]-cysteine S-methyltransferase
MTRTGFTLFGTAIGPCGIAWGVGGIVGVQLPEADPQLARHRMQRRFSAVEMPPPPDVVHAIARIVSLLDGAPGDPADLSDLVLDMAAVPPFHRRVYAAARRIGPGATTTYGDMARLLGEPGAARAVGQALGHNPFAPVVPCHRILAASGGAGGFSAAGGTRTKLRLLEIEGAQFGGPGLFDRLP